MKTRVVPMTLAFAGVIACGFSSSLLQDPRPMPPGKVRFALALESDPVIPFAAVGLRVGVAPRLELRGKATPGGGEVGANVHAFDGDRVDVSAMPQFFAYDVDSFLEEEFGTKLKGLSLPVVAGVSLGERRQHQVFVAPDLRVGKRDDDPLVAVGAHLGASIAGPNDYGAFIPECGWFVGLTSHDPYDEYAPQNSYLARGNHTVTCGIGVSLGGTHTPRE